MSQDSYAKMKIELDFLSALESGEVITQMNLKQRVGVSVGLINALLKRAINKGYVKARQAPYKRYAYYLTPQGFAEKSRLVSAYLESSMDFLRNARVQYAEIFEKAQSQKKQNIILAGDGELAEIAVLATLGDASFEMSVYAPDNSKDSIYGLKIIRDLTQIKNDQLVVLTESKNAQEMFEIIKAERPELEVVWPALLHITPDIAALVEKQKRENADA